VRLSALTAEQAAALLAAQPRKSGNKSWWLRALINQVLSGFGGCLGPCSIQSRVTTSVQVWQQVLVAARAHRPGAPGSLHPLNQSPHQRALTDEVLGSLVHCTPIY
jgi:hypothetical protein